MFVSKQKLLAPQHLLTPRRERLMGTERAWEWPFVQEL